MRKRMWWTVGIVFFGVVLAWLGVGQAQRPNEWVGILKNFRPDVDYVKNEILIALDPSVLSQVKVDDLIRNWTPKINRLGYKIDRFDYVGYSFRPRPKTTRICGGAIITVIASGDVAEIPTGFADIEAFVRTSLSELGAGLEDDYIIAPNVVHHMPQDLNDIPSDPDTATFSLEVLPSQDAKGVKVAVLDSGFVKIPGIRYDSTNAKSFITNGTVTSRDVEADYISFGLPPTTFGHGTPVSEIIASLARNTSILPIKVCDSFKCTGRSVAQGLCWASDNGARVINLSLGGFIESSVVREATRDAIRSGALIVAAAGNTRALSWSPNLDRSRRNSNTWNAPVYPAAWSRGANAFNANDVEDGIISVGSISKFSGTGAHAWVSPFTHLGPTVDVLTYGERVKTNFSLDDLWSPTVGFTTAERSGTSFSAPIISAVAASILSNNIRLTPIQVKSRIMAAVVRYGLLCYQDVSRVPDARNGCISDRNSSAPRPTDVDVRTGVLVESELSSLLQTRTP
jgi:subtilisin family serine protease